MPYRGRVAYPTYVDESLFGNPHQSALRNMKSAAADTNSVGVMSASELTAISQRVNATGRELSTQQAERERLNNLSNERKAKWGNTLEATREKKERARQEKLDAEEAMRVAIDREEDALQAEKRRLAIERANKMLYDSTDRVKALHSKLMLSDVLQERDQQLQVKKNREQRAKIEEERWYQQQQEAIRRMDAEEDAREEEDARKREALARSRAEQIEERRQQFESKLDERRRDGELMKAIAVADLERERRAREVEAEKAAQMRAEFVESNNFLTQKKKEEAKILEAEEERMIRYAKQKERDLLERREREAQRFNERQTWRQKLIDEQISKLQDINSMQNARADAQAVEVQAKAAEARARLEEKKKDELLVTHMSRQQQIRWKAEKKAQEGANAAYYAEQLKSLNAQLREEEAEAIRAKFDKARENQGFLKTQIEQKRQKADEDKTQEMIEAEMTKQWMGDDDAIYENYAHLCLDEYGTAGRDPKPAKLLVEKQLAPRQKITS